MRTDEPVCLSIQVVGKRTCLLYHDEEVNVTVPRWHSASVGTVHVDRLRLEGPDRDIGDALDVCSFSCAEMR